MSLSRRAFVSVLGGFALLAAPVDGFPQSQPIVLRVGHFPNVTHIQPLVARAMERQGKDWFAPRLHGNVKIEWYVYNAGPSAMEAIFAKALDLTYVGPNPALNAFTRSKGAEARVLSGAARGGTALVIQPDQALKTPADFKGKRIATPQLGNTQDVAARAWLKEGGLKITQTGGDAFVLPTANPDQLALFQRKELDAVWTVEPWVTRLEREAGGKILFEDRSSLITLLVARADFLASNPELAWDFVKAHEELTQWIKSNPQEAKALLVSELKATFKADVSLEVISQAFSRIDVNTQVAQEDFNAFVKQAQSVGFLPDTPDLTSFLVSRPRP